MIDFSDAGEPPPDLFHNLSSSVLLTVFEISTTVFALLGNGHLVVYCECFYESMLTFVSVTDSEMEISVQLLQNIDDSFPTVDSQVDQQLAIERNWVIPHKYWGMCHTTS